MDNYGLNSNYTSRETPAYFNDVLPDSALWQADVYRLAANLAQQHDIKNLIDLGCGRGEKLLPYMNNFTVSGIDYGANIAHCHTHLNFPGAVWASWDLNKDVLHPSVFKDSVVICADVIEHLPTPDALVISLKNACKTAEFVLVSTPDRLRVYRGEEHYGPPGNPYHCREWSNAELYAWFKWLGMPVVWHGWTISNDSRPDQVWTSLLVLSQKYLLPTLPKQYESAEWNPVLD